MGALAEKYGLKITISLHRYFFHIFKLNVAENVWGDGNVPAVALLSEEAERIAPLAEATLATVQWRNNEHFESHPKRCKSPTSKRTGSAFGLARVSLD